MKAHDPVTRYALGVVAGRVPAGWLVRAACERHLADLERSKGRKWPFFFDLKAVDKILQFARLLHHHEGPLRGKGFVPDPFQEFILGSLFGWKRRKDGLRRFRYGYVEVPRKNAKTFLASVIALFMLALDGEGGAQVYSAATRKEQAKIVWEGARRFARRSPALRGKFRERYASIEFEKLDGKFEPLPADSDKLDGLNPHCVINDELHAWPSRFLWDVIEDALGARAQPLIFSITTAGYSKDSICYEQREHGVNVLTLEGYEDEETFVYIACPDPEDVEDEEAWARPEVWAKANPALGTAKSRDYMAKQVERALQMPSKEHAVKNKQLNIWTSGEVKWLDVKRFEECGRRKVGRGKGYAFPTVQDAWESMEGRACFGGMDLSSSVDFSSVAYLFPPSEDGEHWAVLAHAWIPEETLRKREKRDRVPVRKWVDEGWITVTDGEVVDQDVIGATVKRDRDRYRIKEIGFDPWNAGKLATELDVAGFALVQMRQGFATMSNPTKELEKMVLGRKLEHFGNPLLCWMARNTQVVRDSNDNLRPAKDKCADRIDEVVALIMALGRALVEKEMESVYERRGPLVI